MQNNGGTNKIITPPCQGYNGEFNQCSLQPETEPVIKSLLQDGASLPDYHDFDSCDDTLANIEKLKGQTKNPMSSSDILQLVLRRCQCYKGPSKPLLQSKAEPVVKSLLQDGAELSIYPSSIECDVIFVHIEDLKSRTKNPMSPTQLFELVVKNCQQYDSRELSASVIKSLLQDGAELPRPLFYTECDVIFVHIEDLKSRTKNPMSSTDLLQFVFSNCYPANKSEYFSLRTKAEAVIKLLLQDGALLPVPHYYSVCEEIFANIEDLKNRTKNPLSSTQLLEFALHNCIGSHKVEYDSLSLHSHLSKKLIKSLIQDGAVLLIETMLGPKLSSFECDVIFAEMEEFQARLKNPLSSTELLKFASTKCWREGGLYGVDAKVEVVIRALIGGGAELPNKFSYGALNVIFAHAPLLLSRAKNPMDYTGLLRWIAEVVYIMKYGELEKYSNEIRKFISFTIINGADIHAQFKLGTSQGASLFEIFFIRDALTLLEKVPDIKISAFAWYYALHKNLFISFIVKMLQQFPGAFSKEEIWIAMRAAGSSIANIQSILDIYSLAKDYLKAIQDINCGFLTAVEISLLSGAKIPLDSGEYKNIELLNRYEFSPLHLALLGKNFDLAKEMIMNGHSITMPSAGGLPAVMLLIGFWKYGLAEDLMSVALAHLDDVDIRLNWGETLVDNLVALHHFTNVSLSLTRDPLFMLLKPDADLFALDSSSVNIAISHGEGIWSSGIWSMARWIREAYPNLSFYLVTNEVIEKGGDKFVRQFNAWINPGASDDYPIEREFTLEDWTTSDPLITLYQQVLNKTAEFAMPSLGICAGAQILALFSGGAVYQLGGAYSTGNHHIVFLEGTMLHFFSMSREQQKVALLQCEFPSIVVIGDTAHHFAASTYKLGSLELGAISTEHGVAMAYNKGLAFGTQFHPEHHWNTVNGSAINHEREFIDNFLHLAQLHHASRNGSAPHPEKIVEAIHTRLQECITAPTSLTLDHPLLGDKELSDAFFD